MVGLIDIGIDLLCVLCGEFDLTTEDTEENKKASRKAYDWPLKLAKLSRHNTSARYACRSSPPRSIDLSR